MKFFATILMILAIVGSSMALKDDVCGLPHSADGNGNAVCLGYFSVFTYRADTNECIPFVYGGCGGNANRFETQDDCEERCKE